jgi:hypothetical protein
MQRLKAAEYGCSVVKVQITAVFEFSPFVKAFKKAGLFPFNPKAVDREEVAPATIYRL